MPQMPHVVRVLGQELRFEATPEQARRLDDLAVALDSRMARLDEREPAAVARLIMVALALLDETQAAGAALMRAHNEIDRLNDQLADARAVHALPRKAVEPTLA